MGLQETVDGCVKKDPYAYIEKRPKVTKAALDKQLKKVVRNAVYNNEHDVYEGRHDLNQMYEDAIGTSGGLEKYAEEVWYVAEEAVRQFRGEISKYRGKPIEETIKGLRKDLEARKNKPKKRVGGYASQGGIASAEKRRLHSWKGVKTQTKRKGLRTPEEYVVARRYEDDASFEQITAELVGEFGEWWGTKTVSHVKAAYYNARKGLPRKKPNAVVKKVVKKKKPEKKVLGNSKKIVIRGMDWDAEKKTDIGEMSVDAYVDAKNAMGESWVEIEKGLAIWFGPQYRKDTAYQRWRNAKIAKGKSLH